MHPRRPLITALDMITWPPMSHRTRRRPNLDLSPTNLFQPRLLPPASLLTRTLNRLVRTMAGVQNLNEWYQIQCLTLIGAHEAGLVVGAVVPVKVFRWRVTAWELLSGRRSAGPVRKLRQTVNILAIRRVRGEEPL